MGNRTKKSGEPRSEERQIAVRKRETLLVEMERTWCGGDERSQTEINGNGELSFCHYQL